MSRIIKFFFNYKVDLKASLLLFALLSFHTSLLSASATDIQFQQALSFYEMEQYGKAVELLEQIIQVEPDNAEYHHALGKVYGHIAAQSKWSQAIKYARLTRQELELAVDLDSHNLEALVDLKNFYEQAPVFLGGNKDKARKIEQRIKQLSV